MHYVRAHSRSSDLRPFEQLHTNDRIRMRPLDLADLPTTMRSFGSLPIQLNRPVAGASRKKPECGRNTSVCSELPRQSHLPSQLFRLCKNRSR